MAFDIPDGRMTLEKVAALARALKAPPDPFDPPTAHYLEALIWVKSRDLKSVSGVRALLTSAMPAPDHVGSKIGSLESGPEGRSNLTGAARAPVALPDFPRAWLKVDEDVANTLNKAMRDAGLLPPVEGAKATDPSAELAAWQKAGVPLHAVIAQFPWLHSLPVRPPPGVWSSLTECLMWAEYKYAVTAANLSLPPIKATGRFLESLRGILELTWRRLKKLAHKAEPEIRGREIDALGKLQDERSLSMDELLKYEHFEWDRETNDPAIVREVVLVHPINPDGHFLTAAADETVRISHLRVLTEDLLKLLPAPTGHAHPATRRAAKLDFERRCLEWLEALDRKCHGVPQRKPEVRADAKKAIPGLVDESFRRVWAAFVKTHPDWSKAGPKSSR